ncbi:MAG: flagellin [Agathobacter sp.]
MVVQHNMQAMNANRMLNVTTSTQAKSTEKLSSGYKINRAADDAAGLTISEKMRKQIKGLDQASTNAEDGVSSVQTAEGALTEVHSMLQRMNELAVQASNGTNSESDRSAIQDEISQLTTEIDRVSETTKFNETYLLKGEDGATKDVYMQAHDAGLKGSLTDGATTATFKLEKGALDAGKSITIGGKEYTIGAQAKNATDLMDQAVKDAAAGNGTSITVNGNTYAIAKDGRISKDGTNLGAGGAADTAAGDLTELKKLAVGGATVEYGGKTVKVMTDAKGGANGKTPDGVDDTDSTVISADHAIELISAELEAANNIGTVDQKATMGTAPNYDATKETAFTINKGYATVADKLSFSLHVGADADMTNKINVDIESMSAAGLGIKGLNVKDDSGKAATYAIDAIADAVSKVSAQRSALGAVQNRLEHTIANVDNVVENTTSAESRIRDTDMAEEMVEYSKNNILAQANQSNQGVLSLLQ